MTEAEAGALAVLHPKLKKDDISFPWMALAKSLGQNVATLTPEAVISLVSLSPGLLLRSTCDILSIIVENQGGVCAG